MNVRPTPGEVGFRPEVGGAAERGVTSATDAIAGELGVRSAWSWSSSGAPARPT